MKHHDDDGIALLIVLWLLAIATIIYIRVYTIAERELSVQALYNTRAQLLLASDDFVSECVAWLDECEDPNPIPYLEDKINTFSDSQPDQINIKTTVWDEGSKININYDTPEILRYLGLNDESIDSLLDWRDIDDYPRTRGVENDYYLGLKTPYHCRNGAISDLAELKMVKGMDEIPSDILGDLSVYGYMNPNIASIEAFDSMLVNAGINTYTAQRVTNELIVYREMSSEPFKSFDEVRHALSSLSEADWQRLCSLLTVDEPVNLNTASKKVVNAICQFLGLDAGQISTINSRASSIKSIQELSGILNSSQLKQFSRYFGVSTRIIGIHITARKNDSNQTYINEVVFIKSKGSWCISSMREL